MPTLQPVHPAARRSFWLEEAFSVELDADRVEPLAGSQRADVCVVGGGYTGLWTALRLKELDPALDVLLLEADLCGSGASGRNGGFVQGWWPKLDSLTATLGEDEGLRTCQAAADSVVEIGAFCVANGIDAHYRQAGWLWTATTPLHAGKWDAAIAAAERRGLDVYTRLTPAEVAARTGSETHVAGVWENVTATVQPALLARGLRRVAIERGVRIAERTPMLSLERGRPPVVRTLDGAVVAEKVVIATNAWMAEFPELRRALIVISSDMVATAPLPDRLEQLGWTGGEAITDARLMVQYYRTTRDGRIAIGRGSGSLSLASRVTAAFNHSAARTREVVSGFHRLYPMLRDVPITHEWGGPIDRTENGQMLFGDLGGNDRILYGVGYSGNGVGPSHLAAKILASRALGLQDEWAGTGLWNRSYKTFPPEPFRFVGGSLVRAAVDAKERSEERGVSPNAALRTVAKLAPSGMQKGAKATRSGGT
ncbi:MAG: FAD-dependent oxidoreductase [Chloroflexia bacterium]|nr:FAD-dependent oxidoreductase [Chloroflexia bacterium]